MNIYREGSKLHDVYSVFLDKGIDAAIAHGASIGLSPSTLKIQVKRKNWGGDTPIAVASPKAIAKATYVPTSTKKRFCMKKGGRQFVIVDQGPQQSVVRYMDQAGETQCVSNGWMIAV